MASRKDNYVLMCHSHPVSHGMRYYCVTAWEKQGSATHWLLVMGLQMRGDCPAETWLLTRCWSQDQYDNPSRE